MKLSIKILFFPIAFLVMWITSTNTQQHQVLYRGNEHRYVNFVRHLRAFLDVTPFLREKVEDLMSCAFRCLKHAACLSFNMAVKPFDNMLYDCLLLATDMYNSSGNLQSSKDFNHHSIQSPCEAFPCHNGGRCRPVYETGEYKCDCASGFVGINCEQSESQLILRDSVILHGHADYDEKLNEYLSPVQESGKQWKLCFRASEHQYSSDAFHTACDNKGRTVTLVRVGIYVFGGYAGNSWNKDIIGWINSNDAFLFSLKNHLNEQHKILIYGNPGYAMLSVFNCGPTFGIGPDIFIADTCDVTNKSYSKLGHTYRPPNGYARDSPQAQNLFAGFRNFKVDEYEVFYQE